MLLLLLILYYVAAASFTIKHIFYSENELNTLFEILITTALMPFVLPFVFIYKISTIKIK